MDTVIDWFFSANTVVGLLGILLGVVVILKAYDIEHRVMHFGLAEKYLGPGSGTLGYKLVGLFIIFLSFMAFVGVIDLFDDTISTSQSPSGPVTTPQNQQLPSPTRGIDIAP